MLHCLVGSSCSINGAMFQNVSVTSQLLGFPEIQVLGVQRYSPHLPFLIFFSWRLIFGAQIISWLNQLSKGWGLPRSWALRGSHLPGFSLRHLALHEHVIGKECWYSPLSNDDTRIKTMVQLYRKLQMYLLGRYLAPLT